VEKWEHYSPNKYNLFQKENLAVKSEAVAKKFYIVAHHLHSELALIALLENWLEKRMDLDFAIHIWTLGLIQIGSPGSPGNCFHLCFWGSTNMCLC
jgi:hypothetical protein